MKIQDLNFLSKEQKAALLSQNFQVIPSTVAILLQKIMKNYCNNRVYIDAMCHCRRLDKICLFLNLLTGLGIEYHGIKEDCKNQKLYFDVSYINLYVRKILTEKFKNKTA